MINYGYSSVLVVLVQDYQFVLLLTGSDVDICLLEFGHCNFISSRQACIFFDKVGGVMISVVKQCNIVCLFLGHSGLRADQL